MASQTLATRSECRNILGRMASTGGTFQGQVDHEAALKLAQAIGVFLVQVSNESMTGSGHVTVRKH